MISARVTSPKSRDWGPRPWPFGASASACSGRGSVTGRRSSDHAHVTATFLNDKMIRSPPSSLPSSDCKLNNAFSCAPKVSGFGRDGAYCLAGDRVCLDACLRAGAGKRSDRFSVPGAGPFAVSGRAGLDHGEVVLALFPHGDACPFSPQPQTSTTEPSRPFATAWRDGLRRGQPRSLLGGCSRCLFAGARADPSCLEAGGPSPLLSVHLVGTFVALNLTDRDCDRDPGNLVRDRLRSALESREALDRSGRSCSRPWLACLRPG